MILKEEFLIKPNVERALEELGKERLEYIFNKEDIEAIHNSVIDKFGGSYGIRDNSLLDSVVVTPYQSVFGIDVCPTLFDKAARYLYDFANYQVFVDGNKRTGLAVCSTLLNVNGYELNMSAEEMYQLVMDVANNKVELEEVQAKIKSVSVFLEEDLQISSEERDEYN